MRQHSPTGPVGVVLAAALALSVGCTSTVGPKSGLGSQPEPPASSRGREQSLYRLTYDSGDGRTALKVVLRQGESADRFQLVFSDLAGRRVWSIDHSAGHTTLVDHRAATHCISGPDLRLPEVHPQELPLAAIPRVLAGRLPVDDGAAGSRELVDRAGRRWLRTYENEELVAWSLLDDDGPAIWWARDREGGLLSRRGGVQYRWQLVVSESSSEPLRDLVPEGSSLGSCRE